MKNILFFLISISSCFNLLAQTDLKFNFEVCNSDFQFYIKKIYSKDIIAQIKFNRDSSYSYYSDFYTSKNRTINYKNSDSLKIVPYQYVLQYDIHDTNNDIITSLKVDCRCYDNLLRIDKIEDLDEILKPAIDVITGKAITVKEACEIAKDKGYSISEWDIDYEKKKGSNDYKLFLPRLVWTLKEKLPEKEGGYYKVLKINAKNGNIISQYEEYDL
ncbi:hypothetical protein CJ739_692 [Mariniflexile rhizosphaerae]|uniref:PepSY domain-containing protein n=1 Tax=unclassified Mariniflexile TaxID=2643887 RepID=UPI000E32FFDA|nr:PepSY domain-containing protein [Mariniflexile sp. TRM1-10]AXP79789.1 hypothetical protein CJ739_692 [Mariniflexile sp. TRM1-10]